MWKWRKKVEPEYGPAAAGTMWRLSKDPTSIGNILRKLGFISDNDLSKALRYKQEHAEILLGEILVQMGALEKDQLESAVEHQKIRRYDASEARTKAIMKKAMAATKKTRDVNESLDLINNLVSQASIKLK